MARKRSQQLSEAQDKELLGYYTQSKDALVRTRCQAVRLYGQDDAVEEIMRITGCSRTSLMEWWSKYQHAGVQGLDDHRLGGNSAKLTGAQGADLTERLQIYSPRQLFGHACGSPDGQFWTVADLQRAVEQWYGVNYQSRSSYHNLFDRCGLSYQRSAKVYKSRSEHKVIEFEAALEK